MNLAVPDKDCSLCPRLKGFIDDNRIKFPDKFNAPVPSFGSIDARLLVVGLAPGLKGANFTGRPFTGDYAGDLLYPTLVKFGFAKGVFAGHPDDGVELLDARITNAVRCVPPENKPTGEEINTCRPFLIDEIAAMKNLKVILCLGLISHNSVLKTLGEKLSAHKFSHAAQHDIGDIIVIDSYHCSRYNTNTGRLTTEMFEDVFAQIKAAF
ncbi:MAG: uracil-DNA glycosylase [Micavibrio sp. TMED27]|nr:uracil-DNA glycosylase [Micavibrio sp.]OUT89721.1 MAG: uracil-DNA glycosylase [Micavibrio sp. TMED27]|tara:strand:- start:2409 stop:3038 length:630 start_codon:yes stop_codon:yes gene_type:complete